MGDRLSTTDKELVRLSAASCVALAAAFAAAAYVSLLVHRSAPLVPRFAPFSGWQLTVVEVLLGAVDAALLAGAGFLVWKGYRALDGETPGRRVAVMVVLLPSLLLGTVAAKPMRAAMDWASNHTAAHSAAIGQFNILAANAQDVPQVAQVEGSPAPAAVAARMLQPFVLGSDWYAGQQPLVAQMPVTGAATAAGVTQGSTSIVQQAVQTNGLWQTTRELFETDTTFVSAAAARHYLRTDYRSATACGCTHGKSDRAARRVIAGHVVWVQTDPSAGHPRMGFLLHADLFTVAVVDKVPATSGPSFHTLIVDAVKQARSSY